MKRILRIIALMLITLVFFACNGGSNAGNEPGSGTPPAADTNATQAPGDDNQVYLPFVTKAAPSDSLTITDISDNRADYSGGDIPKYEKFEITFQVENSVAGNFQFPYDPSPPPGIDPQSPIYQGITVDALFTPDDWNTIYVQPAFYFQHFLEEVHRNKEWFYPTDDYAWKVRFSAHQTGDWQFKLRATDASGMVESNSYTFYVSNSANPGLIQVSQSDPRYFEFDNGDLFPALGYNMNYNGISWINPVLDNEANFQTMSENGIQLARFWLSQWAIFTSAWNPWYSIAPVPNDGYIPFTGMDASGANTSAGSETTMIVNHNFDPCMFIGWQKAQPAVMANTDYRVRVRYLTENIAGPRINGNPYGLVAKVGGVENGGWLWGPGLNCHDPGTGIVVSEYASENTVGTAEPWRIIEGTWNSGNANFLPLFYLAMENVNSGRARIDYVWIEADLGNGEYGPNIVSKPWMSHHLYFEQRNSFAMDKVIDLAHQYGIYLRPVLLEKDEWAMNRILPDGSFGESSPGNFNFHGEWRAMTKTRWLQLAWWRYVQARWGFSPNIHSWELLNEGDPGSDRHYTQADELGKFMKCKVFDVPVGAGDAEYCDYEHPNAHPVSTSFWHSFPAEAFWANINYPNVEIADVHAYISTGWINDPAHESDAAAYHLDYSASTRNRLQAHLGNRATKPIVRGEGRHRLRGRATRTAGPGAGPARRMVAQFSMVLGGCKCVDRTILVGSEYRHTTRSRWSPRAV